MTVSPWSPTIGRARLFAIGALACYGLLAIALYLPVGPLDTTHLPNGGSGDPAQMAWFLAYTPHALAHWQNLLQTRLLAYPHGVNLATNTSVPLLGLLAAPVTATLGPVAAFNLLLRLGPTLSAASLYLVLRRFGVPAPARFLGGLLYGFGPYLIGQSQGNAHLDLSFGAIVPVLFLLLYEVTRARSRDALRLGVLLGLAAAAQFFVAPEALAHCALLGLLALAVAALMHHRELRGRLPQLTRAFGAAALTLGALVAFPLYELFGGAEHLTGAVQPVARLQFFSADLLEPLLPTKRELLAPQGLAHLAHFATVNTSELGGYLGLPLLALLVVVVVANRRHRLLAACAGLAAVAFVFSLGSHLVVHGHVTGLPLPEGLLVHLPFLENTVPARFGLEVALFSAAAIAIGVGELGRRALTTGPRIALIGLGALSVLAAAPRAPLSEAALPWPDSLDATLNASLRPGAVVLSYPYATPPFDEAMLWQASDHLSFSLLGGYVTVPVTSGQFKGDGQQFPQLLEPATVQAFFARATDGVFSHLPKVGTPSPALLCQYLRNNSVTNVVFWPHGMDPAPVGALLGATLGPPVATRDGVSVYSTSSCPPGS